VGTGRGCSALRSVVLGLVGGGLRRDRKVAVKVLSSAGVSCC
jgi:hypothetical protein